MARVVEKLTYALMLIMIGAFLFGILTTLAGKRGDGLILVVVGLGIGALNTLIFAVQKCIGWYNARRKSLGQ